ncbi:MAG: exopolyphosphatase [Myxococcales bacterium]|nr:exopolyphosphatase [Myxococcales bacterium]
MIEATVYDRDVRIIDRIRERVQLAAGLDGNDTLSSESIQRGIECLERFGQKTKTMPPESVRAVATHTLRRAKNARNFLDAAEAALGHSIDVISGAEEARLIYLGVATAVADDSFKRLVIDIGGGSTECILGEFAEPIRVDSLQMGCVVYTQRFFGDGNITKTGFKQAEIAAALELQSIEAWYRNRGWDSCMGGSGTILACDDILRENGLSDHGITIDGLKKLRKIVISQGSIKRLSISGLKPERASVLPGGLAILIAIFESFGIDHMTVSPGALREGVLQDLVGRMHHEDIRDRTTQRMAERYRVDMEQAARVERTALTFLNQMGSSWNLDGNEHRQFLTWAARLHETGLALSYSGYHKHGAYLIANSDMPGFSKRDQGILAAIIGGHRRKPTSAWMQEVPPSRMESVLRKCLVFRLAVLLNRSRQSAPVVPWTLTVFGNDLHLSCPKQWLTNHPLTKVDLEREASVLKEHGFSLHVE